MAVLSELALGVAHTLNNALTSIGGRGVVPPERVERPRGRGGLRPHPRAGRALRAPDPRAAPAPLAAHARPRECELGRVLRDVEALLRDSLPRRIELSIEASEEPVLLALPVHEAETIVLLLVSSPHCGSRRRRALARLPPPGAGPHAVLELRDGRARSRAPARRLPRTAAPRAALRVRRLGSRSPRRARAKTRPRGPAAPRGVRAMRRSKVASDSQPWSIARARAASCPFVGALILAVVLGLVAITGFGLVALESVRAYVTGEGLYSKAQKAAIYQLARYAETGDERFYERYAEAIAIRWRTPRRASRSQPTRARRAAARAPSCAGATTPKTSPNMVRLFRARSWLPEMERAIEIWRLATGRRGDRLDRRRAPRRDRRARARRSGSRRCSRRLDAVDARLTDARERVLLHARRGLAPRAAHHLRRRRGLGAAVLRDRAPHARPLARAPAPHGAPLPLARPRTRTTSST